MIQRNMLTCMKKIIEKWKTIANHVLNIASDVLITVQSSVKSTNLILQKMSGNFHAIHQK